MSAGGPLPAGVGEAAVMESLAENPYIRDYFALHRDGSGTLDGFVKYCKSLNSQDVNNDPQVQIIQDYLKNNSQAGSYQVLDVTGSEGIGNKILVGGVRPDGTSSYYVGFQGTQEKEWLDNGEGMAQISTTQQRDAAQYFDSMVEKFHITESDNLVVTGHSKGGNKAQYVTLASENADLVDSCVALDGQGFSPEAVAMWERYPDVYEARRDKIILVAGANDYVHVLGTRVAKEENTYYLQYGREPPEKDLTLHESIGTGGLASMTKDTLAEGGDTVMSWHWNQYLFQNHWDPERGCYVFSSNLEPLGRQSEFSQRIQEISQFLMTLPPEERESASLTVMSALGKGSLDGRELRLSDVGSMLVTLDLLLQHYQERGVLPDMEGFLTTRDGIQRLIKLVEKWRAEEAAARDRAASAHAQDWAGDNPSIYMDTALWDQMGSTMRRLAGEYAAIRRKLLDIRTELDDLFSAAGRVLREAGELQSAARQTYKSASEAVAASLAGDPIGAIYASVDAAKSAVNTAQQAIELAGAVINLVTALYEGLKSALYSAASSLAIMTDEDIMRALGEYLSGSAQEFEMAEAQNIALLRKWEV